MHERSGWWEEAKNKGARRQVQGGALAPLWILLFRVLLQLLQNTIHAQSLTQRDTVILYSTERNTTADIGFPQVDTRQTCP